ncbi:hypothetical protein DJ93_4913 [Bacillus clarus]|uniref:Uncharacterized protein n=2 Tax=Bacillus clarus TaxID=2338372 RepID=A0A090YP34_9BACI|nr:hypothetical protein DJ93_4913 [Bacillus clarus]
MIPAGLTADRVRELNELGFPDYKIGPMFGRSGSYISKLKRYWKQGG